MTDDLDRIIARLGLLSHPEGGYYRETFRDASRAGGRAAFAQIYYLLRAGQRSAWHRVDVTEIWHFYGGAPLRLTLSADGADRQDHQLGSDVVAGELPCVVVPPGTWMTAVSLGPWTLIGCTTVPAFQFEGLEFAPPDRQPDPERGR